MSDNHHLNLNGGKSSENGENNSETSSQGSCDQNSALMGLVNHKDHLSENIGDLYLKQDFSDIILKVEGNSLPAHKVILASRSEYFRALLFGGLKESTASEIEVKDLTSLESFQLLLQYVYTGRMSLTAMRHEMVLEVLGLAHKYGFLELEESISYFLRHSLSIKNVCTLFEASRVYCLASLSKECSMFIDRNADLVMRHESFKELSITSLIELVSRDSFCAQEVDIFNAVVEWARANPKANYAQVLACVRLPLISLEDMLRVVRPCELMTADVILDAINERCNLKDSDLRYRGFLLAEENVATPRHGAQVIHGELKSHLLDGEVHNYDMEKGFTRHHIDDGQNEGIVIKLGMQSIVNHMRMLLWDKDMRSYSYYVEVSMDQKDWTRVVDHSQYMCRSWQNLYFPQRVVRYIRIVGTHNTVNRVFHVVSFECLFTEKPFDLDCGLVVPKTNVATIGNSACVIEGVSRSRNALINGDWENYDWDTGYTCHQLGSGAIVVQLSQPYMIDSMRLLLWDIDTRTYSYYIEVSVDQANWHQVHDMKAERCKSWQYITFSKRPVVFIRIVGTYNTANEVFHCVHFECPAQVTQPCASTTSKDPPPKDNPSDGKKKK